MSNADNLANFELLSLVVGLMVLEVNTEILKLNRQKVVDDAKIQVLLMEIKEELKGVQKTGN